MASLIYNSFFDDLARGAIDLDSDTFKVMLVTSSYTEDQDTHLKRSSVTNEVDDDGTGYDEGGATVTVSVAKDLTNNRLNITLGGAAWPASSFTARKAVYYKSRGGASSADELIAVIDFGSDKTSASGTFTLSASTIRVQL